MSRVKKLVGLVLVDYLIVNRDKIRLCLSRLFVAYSVNLFEVWRGYLSYVFAYLYLGNDISVLIFNSANLVNAAENRIALRSAISSSADITATAMRATKPSFPSR